MPAVEVPMSQALQEFNAYVNTLAIDDDEDVQLRILEQILKATTPHEILNAGEAIPATELLNVPLEITGIRASESGFVEGNDFYLHVDAIILANKDKVTFSTGSQDVCVKLVQLARHKFLPMYARLEQADRPTKKGFFPVFLRALDKDQEPF